ncbi:hypothetical protein BHM03_00056855 [Ensete ventricosum]|nr:hypothetical protein BHM03_00056855 [Ensete ventricosum]
MRDRIMQRYDQELLGALLWCTTQQEEGLWIQGVNAMVPQRRVFVCASKLALDESLSHRYKATDSRAMGLAAPWYRRGETSVESSIPCFHGGRALVVKGAGEVENAKANSKYQDRAEG